MTIRKKNSQNQRSKTESKEFPYYTIGVRFMRGDISKVYTYKVERSKKIKHGDLLVADTPFGPAVVAVVRIDARRQDTEFNITYKFIEHRVSPL